MFEDTSTIPEESPVIGQEEAGTEEQQGFEGADNQQEADPNASQGADESSPESGQEEQADDEVVPAATHKELRAAFTRKAQEAAELRRRLDAMQGEQQRPPVQQGQGKSEPQTMAEFQTELNTKVAAMKEEGVHDFFIDLFKRAETAEFRSNQLERRLDSRDNQDTTEKNRNYIQSSIKAMESDYPEITSDEGRSKLADKILEIGIELGTPQIVNRPSERILKLAANEIWGDGKAQLYQKGKEKGKQEALDNIRAKQGVTTTITKKPNEQPKSAEEQLADKIVGAGRSGGIFG